MALQAKWTVGFSGSREGITDEQRNMLHYWMLECGSADTIAYHGLCVGADEEFHDYADYMGWPIVGMPAYELGHPMRSTRKCDEVMPITHPLSRNQDIVNESQMLFFCPGLNSKGTWATIKMARSAKKEGLIIYADGKWEPL